MILVFYLLSVIGKWKVFSKAGIGVYFYNLNTGRVQRIPELTGKENFDLLEYKDGILTYDNTQIRLQF